MVIVSWMLVMRSALPMARSISTASCRACLALPSWCPWSIRPPDREENNTSQWSHSLSLTKQSLTYLQVFVSPSTALTVTVLLSTYSNTHCYQYQTSCAYSNILLTLVIHRFFSTFSNNNDVGRRPLVL